jgi:ABC-type transporter Mla subunit MlaD
MFSVRAIWLSCLACRWSFAKLAKDSLEILIMSNEETERQMAFIIGQQAQFVADIQQLREVQAQTEQIVARLASVTLEGFKDVNAKIDALVDSQIRLNESQSRTDQNLARTDESLRNLIAVVDRYFSEGRNRR